MFAKVKEGQATGGFSLLLSSSGASSSGGGLFGSKPSSPFGNTNSSSRSKANTGFFAAGSGGSLFAALRAQHQQQQGPSDSSSDANGDHTTTASHRGSGGGGLFGAAFGGGFGNSKLFSGGGGGGGMVGESKQALFGGQRQTNTGDSCDKDDKSTSDQTVQQKQQSADGLSAQSGGSGLSFLSRPPAAVDDATDKHNDDTHEGMFVMHEGESAAAHAMTDHRQNQHERHDTDAIGGSAGGEGAVAATEMTTDEGTNQEDDNKDNSTTDGMDVCALSPAKRPLGDEHQQESGEPQIKRPKPPPRPSPSIRAAAAAVHKPTPHHHLTTEATGASHVIARPKVPPPSSPIRPPKTILSGAAVINQPKRMPNKLGAAPPRPKHAHVAKTPTAVLPRPTSLLLPSRPPFPPLPAHTLKKPNTLLKGGKAPPAINRSGQQQLKGGGGTATPQTPDTPGMLTGLTIGRNRNVSSASPLPAPPPSPSHNRKGHPHASVGSGAAVLSALQKAITGGQDAHTAEVKAASVAASERSSVQGSPQPDTLSHAIESFTNMQKQLSVVPTSDRISQMEQRDQILQKTFQQSTNKENETMCQLGKIENDMAQLQELATEQIMRLTFMTMDFLLLRDPCSEDMAIECIQQSDHHHTHDTIAM
ncbi:unnamed protein product [Vitrella brassicaformis CCMP3155]|uniref:Uncharacterized protein n=1 Tax=Vitrella brassicaformis (strain CCMP3155) TaxID=1169540 RepID=A0A0G4ETF7_VITBC|nr:unnamed protein product [Vitrella brassicaformis CCMP3155]|eukprot:CEM01527.1 unnamed protein product [Vitrella brassicaformis CCMP3155]